MKKSGIVAASVAVASATAATAASTSADFSFNIRNPFHQMKGAKSEERDRDTSDKFAPRFDGLRFIETLVTAHR